MAHDTPTITAEPRERVGTRYSQRLRQSGRLPAVVYGHKVDPIAISVAEEETISHLRHGAHVMNLEIEGVGTETCLVKDLQFGFMGDDVIHVDFTRVNLDETVTVNVSINVHGTLSGAKETGSIVVTDLAEIEVTCAVRDIPEAFRVDLEGFEDSATIGDINIPENVTPVLPLETTVVHVVFQAEEEEEAPEVLEGEEGEAASAAEGEAASETPPAADDAEPKDSSS